MRNNRILIVDDDLGVRHAYQAILSPASPSDILARGSALFGETQRGIGTASQRHYELTLADNGEKGILAVEEALNTPFAAAFVDMKMPGIDGAETARRILQIDPHVKIVIVTAFSEYTMDDIINITDKEDLFYLRKPFNSEEIKQFARALTTQWSLERELEMDLQAAAEIQKSLIPKESPGVKNFHFAWQFIPCKQIGGDIFNIHQLDESHLAIYIVDVSGHGVPAAMVTVSVSQTLLPTTGFIFKKTTDNPPHYEIIPPSEVLTQLDREYPLDRFDKYFTISYFILNTETGHIRYSSAAHPMPALIRANGDIEILKEGGSIIGMENAGPFEEGETLMGPGDRLFLYTDGIVECMNEADEEFGTEKFYQILQQGNNESLNTICKRVVTSVFAHTSKTVQGGITLQDDLTLLALECQRE